MTEEPFWRRRSVRSYKCCWRGSGLWRPLLKTIPPLTQRTHILASRAVSLQPTDGRWWQQSSRVQQSSATKAPGPPALLMWVTGLLMARCSKRFPWPPRGAAITLNGRGFKDAAPFHTKLLEKMEALAFCHSSRKRETQQHLHARRIQMKKSQRASCPLLKINALWQKPATHSFESSRTSRSPAARALSTALRTAHINRAWARGWEEPHLYLQRSPEYGMVTITETGISKACFLAIEQAWIFKNTIIMYSKICGHKTSLKPRPCLYNFCTVRKYSGWECNFSSKSITFLQFSLWKELYTTFVLTLV